MIYDQLDLEHVLDDEGGVRVSLFAPMERVTSRAQKNAIRFKNLIRETRGKLKGTGLETRVARDIEDKLLALLEDDAFWQCQQVGLAVFVSPDECRRYRLPIEIDEATHVAQQYQLLPLLPLLAAGGEIDVLALSRNCVRWFRSNRFCAREMSLPADVPRSLTDTVGTDVEEQHLQFRSGPAAPMYHGQGGGKDDVLPELERFCREVAAGLEDALGRRHAELVLAGDPRLTAVFGKVAAPHVTATETLAGNFDTADAADIHTKLEQLFSEREARAIEHVVERFQTELAQDRGSYQPDLLAAAAHEGRVADLLVGQQNAREQPASKSTLPVTPNDELTNRIVIETLRHGGAVHAVARSSMPDSRYLAGILRY